MANRPALITKVDATRLLKAARASGYRRARMIAYPDGKVEVIVDDSADDKAPRANEWDEVLH